MAGIDNGTRGTYYFDAFESRKTSYIGAAQPNPSVTTITYLYDPLYRLKEANYSDGRYFRYTYDSVGNPTEYRNALPPPISSEFLGTTVQQYRYDPLERVVEAAGSYELSGRRHQRYTLSLTRDADGNVTAKSQYDATVKKAMPIVPQPIGC